MINYREMDIMEQLFASEPEIYAILEELLSYSDQLIIPVGLSDYGPRITCDTVYPMVMLMSLALNTIMDTLKHISLEFLVKMMKKYRYKIKLTLHNQMLDKLGLNWAKLSSRWD